MTVTPALRAEFAEQPHFRNDRGRIGNAETDPLQIAPGRAERILHVVDDQRGARRDKLKRRWSSDDRSRAHATPSFFCRLVDEVVYWKVSFLSG